MFTFSTSSVFSFDSDLETRVTNKMKDIHIVVVYHHIESIFTGSGVGLVAGACDLGGLLHLVARLVAGRSVGSQSDHPAGETRQVTHLVLQQPPLPLRDVGQPAARLPHQVRFYRLEDRQRGRA